MDARQCRLDFLGTRDRVIEPSRYRPDLRGDRHRNSMVTEWPRPCEGESSAPAWRGAKCRCRRVGPTCLFLPISGSNMPALTRGRERPRPWIALR